MTDIRFEIAGVKPAAQTAAPAIVFTIRITDAGAAPIHAMVVRCQVQIDARSRRYTAEDKSRLFELFGEPAQWDRTLTSVVWAQIPVAVTSFDRTTDVDVAVPCTYDMDVASAKYLHGIRDGEVPLLFLFTGSVFRAVDGRMNVEPIPWDREASCRMSAAAWHEAMDRFFPGAGWIRLRRETLDALHAFRGRRALTSWDDALGELLEFSKELA